MYEYTGITFMLNRKCKYECDSCFNNCNGEASEKLKKEVVVNTLNQLSTNVREICFTGGEPFEEYEELKEYINLARKKNKIVECQTSCFWADDYEHTYKLLKELRKAGLARIIIDYDGIHYHREKVNNVINVIATARKIHIGLSMKVTNTKNKKLGDEINLLGSKVIGLVIKVLEDKKDKRSKILENNDIKKGLKRNIFIDYNGNLYSYMNEKIINNIYDEKDLNIIKKTMKI